MSCYTEPGSHSRDIDKLEMSNYGTEKNIDHATGADTSGLTAKKGFIVVKSEVDELDLIKLVNVPTNLNSLKTNVNDINVGNLI